MPDLTSIDHTRLHAWLAGADQLTDLAQSLGLSVVDLVAWARQQHIAEVITTLQLAANQRAAFRYAQAQHAAVARLHVIARDSENEEIARRAADRLLRPNIRGLFVADAPEPVDPVAVPTPAPDSVAAPWSQPSPHDTASEVPAVQEDLYDPIDEEQDDLDDEDIDDELDAELDDDLDQEADEIEARLGVPLTHPEILRAIGEGRIADLDHIARTIRESRPP